jgi:hypothetical protein
LNPCAWRVLLFYVEILVAKEIAEKAAVVLDVRID